MHPPVHHPSLLPPDNPLDKYACFLRACYTEHVFTSMKRPPLNASRYINLAVISSKHANKRELVTFRQQTIHGSIDDILEWTAPIKTEDIPSNQILCTNVSRKNAQ